MAIVDYRQDPNLLEAFRAHKRAWKNGEIRLRDFNQRVKGDRPLWYGGGKREDGTLPLGERVLIDKALYFEMVGYKPSLPQCKFHSSLARIRIFSGGARAGKSFAIGMEAVPLLLTPGTQGWIVGPEYSQCEKEFQYILQHSIEHSEIRERYGIDALAASKNGGRVACRPKQGDMEIRLHWGKGLEDSWVRVKSSERPSSLLSEELDYLVLVEAPLIAEDRWQNKLRMRMTTRSGIVFAGATPAGSGDWYAKLYESGLSAKTPNETVYTVTCDSRMNPTLSDEEIRVMTEDMPDADFAEQVLGRPTPKHGLVYPEFDIETHVDSWRKDWPKPGWKRYRAVDFGYQDPFCVLWIAEDEDARLYVYREFYKQRVLPRDVVRYIATAEGWELDIREDGQRLVGPPKRETVTSNLAICDWDAAARADLARSGLRVRKADKKIERGLASVRKALRVQGDGKPRLFVHRSCANLIREFHSYEWDRMHGDRPKGGNDHALDALRYAVHTLHPSRKDVKIALV